MLDSWKIAVTRPAMHIVLLLFVIIIQPAFGEIEVVYESKEKRHGLCRATSTTPIFKGLENTAVQRTINQLLSAEIEDHFIGSFQGFENDPFCEGAGAGNGVEIEGTPHLLSKDLISISISRVGGGVHPWYERTTYNFDPHSGNQYSLSDLIPDETMGWLKRKIKQEIEKDKHQRVDDLDETTKEYFEEYLEIFYVGDRDIWAPEPELSIHFDFNTVLFSHGAGPTIVEIKLSELVPQLPTDSLLFKLAMEESE